MISNRSLESPSDVIDRFLASAEATPDHLAIDTRSGSATYSSLEQRVRRYAAAIGQHLAPRVLIALPQGIDAYAAMLAVGLSGGYYIPVNIATPKQKLRLILRVAEPTVIIHDSETSQTSLEAITEDLPTAALLDTTALSNIDPLQGRGTRHEIAYIIFTSGSTGVPKGVVIPRSALNHYVGWATEALALVTSDRVSQHPNIGFDLSVLDIYATLCAGATLCPLQGTADRLLPARFVANQKITVWISVPSVLDLMRDARQIRAAQLESVRLFLFCGEPLLRNHLDDLFLACPDAIVLNTYGPTESTVSVTIIELKAESYSDACQSSIALGNPIPGVGLHLVGGPNPDEGEIVLTGRQVALGYWNDPVLTADRFRSFDVAGVPTRGYFTGDWAERRGGLLFFRERTDFQVKLHGYRIELDEVAAAIRACGWPTVCVFVRNDTLVAVVEAPEHASFDASILRAAVAQKLDGYAVPRQFCAIAHMPRNLNDKLDRGAVIGWYDSQASLTKG